MRRESFSVVVLLVVALGPISPRSARAEGGADVARAREHFMRGVELYQGEEYEAALADFLRANELAPHYGLLYNIGLVQAHLEHYSEAVTALERYLAGGGAEVPERRVTEVQQLLRRFRSRVGRIRVTVHGPAAAVLSVDGEEVGPLPTSGPLAVTAGRRTVEVHAEGYLPFRRQVIVAGGVEVPVAATLVEVQAQMGGIVLSLAVPGARVSLDGEVVGTTPLEGPLVATPGRHVVEAVRDGYEPAGRTVEVRVGEFASLELALRPRTDIPTELAGRIAVDPSEPDAEVLLDGAPLPDGPVPVGAHVLEVRLEGFQPWWGEVEVEAGEVASVEAALRPTEGFLGRYRHRVRVYHSIAAATLGLGLALLGTDLGFLIWNYQRDQDFDAEEARLAQVALDPDHDEDQLRDDFDANRALGLDLEQWNVAMWALLAAGVAVVGAGVAIFAASPRLSRYPELSVAPSPTGLFVSLEVPLM
jgi:hypothetical protein